MVERLHALLHPGGPSWRRRDLSRIGGCTAGQAEDHGRGGGDRESAAATKVQEVCHDDTGGRDRRRRQEAIHAAPHREEHTEAERQLPPPAEPL